MPRGGRRPGAGARPGNWNALKTGRYSPRFQQALAALRADPQFRQAFRLLQRVAQRTHDLPPAAHARRLRRQLRRVEALLEAVLRAALQTSAPPSSAAPALIVPPAEPDILPENGQSDAASPEGNS